MIAAKMATAREPSVYGNVRLLDEESVDLAQKLRCVSCDRYFNFRERLPRLLRCLHAICGACASKIIQDSAEIVCACGFKTTTVGASIDQLAVDERVTCLIRFLTPRGFKDGLDSTNVPHLLMHLRDQVSIAVLSNSLNAVSLDEKPSVAGEGGLVSDPGSRRATHDSHCDSLSGPLADVGRPHYRPEDFARQDGDGGSGRPLKTRDPSSVISGSDSDGMSREERKASSAAPIPKPRRRFEKQLRKTGQKPSSQNLSSEDEDSSPPVVRTPPPTRRGKPHSHLPMVDPSMAKFATVAENLSFRGLKAICVVCKLSLREKSPHKHSSDASTVVMLECKCLFHHNCIVRDVQQHHKRKFVVCPMCTKPSGIEIGTQPMSGMMDVHFLRRPRGKVEQHRLLSSQYKVLHDTKGRPEIMDSLPGFPNMDSICIHYYFVDGTQGPEHPSPGQPYRAKNFPRIAYLPFNEEGYKVLCMLKIAFERRLIFKIGYSETHKTHDCVVWAGIRHKTTLSSGEYGFPDPGYLRRVTDELAAHQVTPDDIPDNPRSAFGLPF